MKRRVAPVLVFAGPSGAGKTRLLVRLLPALRARGLTVCALKHTGHLHPFDRRGKDTERLRRAGAEAVAIGGPAGMALFGPPVAGLRALAALLPPCDLIVAEGFKSEPVPKIEVHRRAVGGPFLCERDRRVLAVVSDEPAPRPLPIFAPGDIEAIADFVADLAANPGRRQRQGIARRPEDGGAPVVSGGRRSRPGRPARPRPSPRPGRR